mgnify:FL=1|tara:strand:- start:635 stop:823 length:189 start_codon:yes stop_codon:yes gene_type:complete
MNIITDKRKLNAMIKRGLITDTKYGVLPQIDSKLTRFIYKGKEYQVKYFDGSFYPFVVEEKK